MTTIDLTGMRDLNPWALVDGQDCYQILVDVNTTLPGDHHVKYLARVGVPTERAVDVEHAAEIAFGAAQDDGLDVELMALCSFYYFDDSEESWVHFL